MALFIVVESKVGLLIVKLLQELDFLQSLESFHDCIFLVNLGPDDDEEHPRRHGDEAEHSPEVLVQVDQQMEEEASAAQDQGQDEHDVHQEPGDDQATAVTRGGDHEEDGGGEAEQEGDQDPGQDGGGGGGADQVPGASDVTNCLNYPNSKRFCELNKV